MSQSSLPTSSPSKTSLLDAPLHALGFEIEDMSSHKVTGRLLVTHKCCQPFNVLHGGVSALIAEGLASIGAHIASGHRRVAGVQLTINHLKPAEMGSLVLAEATPVNVGKTIQVWDVRLWKTDSSKSENNKTMVATARVTLLSNMSIPESAETAVKNFRKYAKL